MTTGGDAKTSLDEDETSELEPSDTVSTVVSTVSGFPARMASRTVAVFRGTPPWFHSKFTGMREFFRAPGPRLRAGVTQLRREMDSLSWIQLIALIVVFALFLIVPLLSVAVYSFTDQNTGLLTLDHFINLFNNTGIWPFANSEWARLIHLNIIEIDGDVMTIRGWDLGAIMNSIYVAVIVTGVSVLIGTFFAFIVARYDFRGKRIVRTLLIFPILATPFIGAIGIRSFLGQYGLVNNLLYGTLGILPYRIVIEGLAAVIFVQSFSFFSLVYLNAYSSFMSIDPSLEEQAENLGATGFKLFRSVTLPLAMPGIQAGAILTFILSIEDLGTPIIFRETAGGQARKTLAYMVFEDVATGAGEISPVGPAIGMILLVFALVGFLAIRKYASLRSYTSGTKGGQWNPRTRQISSRTTVLLYAVLVPVLFLALIPQLSVLLLSVSAARETTAVIPELTLGNYIGMAETYPNVLASINLTLVYGAIATVFIVLLGSSAAYLIARKDIPGKMWLDLLVTSPIALPGIVIATGYFTVFYGTPLFPASAPAFLITMSYTIRKFPFTVRAAYAGLLSTPVDLEEASQNVGASKNQTFRKITLPLIGVSVLAGSLLSFVYSVSEVSTSLILGGVGPDQAPMTYWTEVLSRTQAGTGFAAVLGVLMMALQMVVITVTNKILGTKSSAMTGI